MPTYQYACTECSHAFDQVQKFTDDALSVCPVCEGKLRKIYNAVGVVFKGTGFYRTDSRDGGVPGTPPTTPAASSDSSSESSSTKTESSGDSGSSGKSDKPATKSEPSPAKPSTTSSSTSGTSSS